MKDHDNLQAFYLNDESDPDDEFSPENLLDPDELDTNCMGNCFSDADPGL